MSATSSVIPPGYQAIRIAAVQRRSLHPIDGTYRISAMELTSKSSLYPGAAALDDRDQRVLDMLVSLATIFGDRALAVVHSQPPERDVGRNSGIRWQDLSDALRTNRGLFLAPFLPDPDDRIVQHDVKRRAA